MGTQTMPEPGLVFADKEGVIRMWSADAERLFGHDAAAAIVETLDLIVLANHRERHWAAYRAAINASEGRIDRASAKVPALCHGEIARLIVRLLVIHDGRGQVAGAVVFAPDDDAAPALYRL
jgi:PAS domain S-box-containing protein